MDLNKFLNAQLARREAAIEVPELESFFEDEDPVWKVRALNANEFAKIEEATSDRGEKLRALVQAMAGSGDKAEALKDAFGLDREDTAEDITRRIEILMHGSVQPELSIENRDVAVQLAEYYPTTFYNITNKILNLTGQGAEEVKP